MSSSWKLETRQKPALAARFGFRISRFVLAAALLAACLSVSGPSPAQQDVREVVANLASGRVVIYVAKDGMVIAAHENRFEAEARPPAIVPLGATRAAVLLGAVEWVRPGSGREPVRLDGELAASARQVVSQPRLQKEQGEDIEAFGMALLEPLRNVAQDFHLRVNLPPDEPLLEILLVQYADQYGPEVWLLSYRMAQDPLRGDYWRTRVLRPSYTQLYPPEKGKPRTLVEVRYPPEDPGPALADLFAQSDPRLTPLRTSNVEAARAAEKLAHGECNKASLADAVVLLRASLDALTSPKTVQMVATVTERNGFEWILAPPKALQKLQEKPREAGAPTLRKKPD